MSLFAIVACIAVLTVAPGLPSRPDRLVHIVTTNVTPGVDHASFQASPRTLYRMGSRFGRIEEAFDPAMKMQALVVVSEPDVWMVNQHDHTGRHIVDPGPSFIFRAPILEQLGPPTPFDQLEYGRERAFIQTHARMMGSTTAESAAGKSDTYEFAQGGCRVRFVVRRQDGHLLRVSYAQNGLTLLSVTYLVYETDLTPNASWFRQPSDIRFAEIGPSSSN